MQLSQGPSDGAPLATLSPIFASIELCERLGFRRGGLARACSLTNFWLIVVAGVAAALYVATRVTFDRCLGRVPDRDDELSLGPEPDRRYGRDLPSECLVTPRAAAS
jgi:hypothetical protein